MGRLFLLDLTYQFRSLQQSKRHIFHFICLELVNLLPARHVDIKGDESKGIYPGLKVQEFFSSNGFTGFNLASYDVF